MAKLNQVLAIEQAIKSAADGEVTALYKAAQKPDAFNGFSKTYSPLDDNGDRFPDEKKLVVANASDVLASAQKSLTDLFTVISRKDWTNTVAKADVVVGGQTILQGAPVSFLLFLEKRLKDFQTLVTAMPTLDPAENWTFDPNTSIFKSDPTETHKTKKIEKPIVLYPATVEHPAQTKITSEDVIIGHWSQVKFSGAMKKPDKVAILARIVALTQAVKEAREAANMQDEVQTPPMSPVFDYILGVQQS